MLVEVVVRGDVIVSDLSSYRPVVAVQTHCVIAVSAGGELGKKVS